MSRERGGSPRAAERPRRVIALDFGGARCGCAVSDPSGTLATPLDPIEDPASNRGLGRLAALARELEAEAVVVGLPIRLSGGEGRQAAATREFVERLRERLDVPVETYDERFTTKLARRTGGLASEDSRAAAHLLSDYLAQNA